MRDECPFRPTLISSRAWRSPSKTKIVLLVARRPRRAAPTRRADRAGDGPAAPTWTRLARRRRLRPEPPRRARHHAGQRAGAPGAVRLRPAGVPDRPRRPRSPGHRLRPAARRRGGPGELLHRSTRTGRSPTAGPAASPPRDEPSWWSGCGRSSVPGVEMLRRAGEGAPLRAGAPRRRAGRTLNDTDPQATGVAAAAGARPEPGGAHATADLVNRVRRGRRAELAGRRAPGQHGRCCAASPQLPDDAPFPEVYGLKAAAIAVYPMYRGPRAAGRHGRPRDRHDARRRGRARCASTGTTTTSSSCTTSTPTRPARTATSPAKVEAIEQLDAAAPGHPELRPGRADRDRRPLDAGDDGRPLLAPGAGAGGRDVAIPDGVEHFAERACAAGSWACSRPTT